MARERTASIGHDVYQTWVAYQVVASASSVKFYLDGNLVATHTTNIPTAALNLYFKTDDGGFGSVPVRVNHVSLERRS